MMMERARRKDMVMANKIRRVLMPFMSSDPKS